MAINDDCIDVMATISDESVDLIFADPPYNIGKDFERRILDRDEYVVWCRKWIDECMRVLKPAGTFYLMAATQFMPYLDSHVDGKWTVISRIVWHYDSSGVQARKHFGSMYEPILMIVKDEERYKFNADAVMVEARTGAKRKLIDYRKTPPQPYKDKKVMGNVWEIPRVRYMMDEYENHPTQKPEKLLEIPILASSDAGDVVLDPFSGSFTTCVVAQRLGRKCVGIELDEEYYKMGLRRLGLATEFKGEPLVKVKVRKTTNKSKRDHVLAGTLVENQSTLDELLDPADEDGSREPDF
ncbi:MAG TPA: adenine-specific DNA-methyltransferase [Candidatus Lokiarchaeia archaeon]|nr:adenine-specific DNA-methyltransferase [Candidatus Lokiarchaeia archaeon]